MRVELSEPQGVSTYRRRQAEEQLEFEALDDDALLLALDVAEQSAHVPRRLGEVLPDAAAEEVEDRGRREPVVERLRGVVLEEVVVLDELLANRLRRQQQLETLAPVGQLPVRLTVVPVSYLGVVLVAAELQARAPHARDEERVEVDDDEVDVVGLLPDCAGLRRLGRELAALFEAQIETLILVRPAPFFGDQYERAGDVACRPALGRRTRGNDG